MRLLTAACLLIAAPVLAQTAPADPCHRPPGPRRCRIPCVGRARRARTRARAAMPSPPTMSHRNSGRSAWSRRARRAAGSSRCRSAGPRYEQAAAPDADDRRQADLARTGQGCRPPPERDGQVAQARRRASCSSAMASRTRRYGFDDYRGLDVRGKIVVALAGTPGGLPSDVDAHLNASKDAVRGRSRGDRLCRIAAQ